MLGTLLWERLARLWSIRPGVGPQLRAPVHGQLSVWSLPRGQMTPLPQQAPRRAGPFILPCGGRFSDGATVMATQMEKLGSCAGWVRGRCVCTAAWFPTAVLEMLLTSQSCCCLAGAELALGLTTHTHTFTTLGSHRLEGEG